MEPKFFKDAIWTDEGLFTRKKLTASPFDLSAKESHKSDHVPQQLSQGNAPAVQKVSRSRERARTGKERLYPLHKSHTTQVATSKARQSCLKSPGSLNDMVHHMMKFLLIRHQNHEWHLVKYSIIKQNVIVL
ncbi:hypothetical protein TNCV_194541 [Trichonephila clavipes]|nr:hypothetical protein TNCV_194541 [Trichonephila clavipes]